MWKPNKPPAEMWKPKTPPKSESQDNTNANNGNKSETQGKDGKGQGHARTDSTRQPYAGRRIAQIVKLKPEFVDKYKEVHAAVWPEVLRQIRDCNIRDCEF